MKAQEIHIRYDPADASIPGDNVTKEFEDNPGPCPNCGRRLFQHTHTYLVATRYGYGAELGDAFILGSDFGWFCPDCPTPRVVKRHGKNPSQY